MTLDDFYGYAGVPLPGIFRGLWEKAHGVGSEPPAGLMEEFLAFKMATHKADEAASGASPPAIECVVELARASGTTIHPP